MSSDSDDDKDPKLPHDVALEVLKRLPVEDLLQFRRCRSWRSAIDDPYFVALHLSHSALDASHWYLVCLDWRNPLPYTCSLFPNESLGLPSQSKIEIPFGAPSYSYLCVGSCNGLICVTEYTTMGSLQTTMYLWNLFTREHKAVRPSGLDGDYLSVGTVHLAQGFGFDARSNDYKIVRILFCPQHHSRGFVPKPRVEIYSLSTDSWRSLEREVPTLRGSRPAVFFNGNLHWFTFELDHPGLRVGCASIVSFDVAGEVFDEMALPEEMFRGVSGGLLVSLAALNDLLAVFISLRDGVVHPEPPSLCSIWVMGEYRAPESWTKLYTFEACGQVTNFHGFTRNGELLMQIKTGGRVSWNPTTGQNANLPLSTECDLVTIVGSLVSLDR